MKRMDGKAERYLPSSSHVFVDESKRGGGFVLCAVWIAPDALGRARAAVRRCLAPGQRRIHFTSEGRARRLAILGELCGLAVDTVIIDASGHPGEIAARARCFEALLPLVLDSNATRLVVELDETQIHRDQRTIRAILRHRGTHEYFAWEFVRPHEDVLLGLPDAFAWCWTKGGEWRERIEPSTTRVIRL
jgi:hypothetical protein